MLINVWEEGSVLGCHHVSIGKGYLRTCGKDVHMDFMILNNWPARNTNITSCLQMRSDAPNKACDHF